MTLVDISDISANLDKTVKVQNNEQTRQFKEIKDCIVLYCIFIDCAQTQNSYMYKTFFTKINIETSKKYNDLDAVNCYRIKKLQTSRS